MELDPPAMSSPCAAPVEEDGMAANDMTGEASTQPLQGGPSLPINEAATTTNREDAKLTSSECPVPGNIGFDEKKPKKPKRKSKSKAARGPGAQNKSRGTGFEGKYPKTGPLVMVTQTDSSAEFYCDPPVTPAEALEEQTDIYPPYVSRIRGPWRRMLLYCTNRYCRHRPFVEYVGPLLVPPLVLY